MENIKNIIIEELDTLQNYLLDNISYDTDANKLNINDEFSKPNVKDIINNLKRKSDNESINKLNVRAFLRKINQIIDIKKRSTRRIIREEFQKYLGTIDDRIAKLQQKFPEEDHLDRVDGEYSILPRKKYENEKFKIQIELLKLQEWVVKNNEKVAIVFEGRDAAGKGSTIKRFIEYLNPAHFRVVALGIPTDEEKNNWFQRYERHMPKEGEIVFFDRSWYNRAVVEPAMGYCSEEQYEHFMKNVTKWEESLQSKGFTLFKLWFSISKDKQNDRFERRIKHPLKYWKYSPNDAKALDAFESIGNLKNRMFTQTSNTNVPWVIINSEDKKVARLNAMRYILDEIQYEGKDDKYTKWYPEVVHKLD